MGALVAYVILRNDAKNTTISQTHKILILSKLVEEGLVFEYDVKIYNKLIKHAKTIKPVYLYEYISDLFRERKLAQMQVKKSKKKKKTPKQRELTKIIKTHPNEIYQVIEQEMVGLKLHLSNHTYPTKLRDDYRFLHNIASTILFHDDSLYEEANLEINTGYILKNVK